MSAEEVSRVYPSIRLNCTKLQGVDIPVVGHQSIARIVRAGGAVAACWSNPRSNPRLEAHALLDFTHEGSRAIKKKKKERRGRRKRTRR